jgi:hypothetical protein
MNQSQKEVVEGHLSANETIHATRSGDDRLIVVTDARILTVTGGSDGGRAVRTVTSTLLNGPHVVGARVTRKDTSSVNLGEFVTGLLVGLVGFGAFGASVSVGGMGGLFIVFLGLALVGGGGYICYTALHPDDAELKATIRTVDDEPNHSVSLPADSIAVARAISTIVGTR